MRRRLSPLLAAAASATLFAALHGYGVVGFMDVFWMGFVSALVFERWKSLLPSVLSHATFNACALASELMLA